MKESNQPLVGSAVLQAPQCAVAADPYRQLDDLMAVVEALCPTWPERATFANAGRMIL